MRVEIQLGEYINNTLMQFHNDPVILSQGIVCNPFRLRDELVKLMDYEINRRLKWLNYESLPCLHTGCSMLAAILEDKDQVRFRHILSDGNLCVSEFNEAVRILGDLIYTVQRNVDDVVPNAIWNTVTTDANMYFYVAYFGEDFRILDYERLVEIEKQYNKLLSGDEEESVNDALPLGSFAQPEPLLTPIRHWKNDDNATNDSKNPPKRSERQHQFII